MVGGNINGVQLEEALIERIYTELKSPISVKCTININTVDWLFMVGIYKSKGKYYLLLDTNDHNSEVEYMIEENTLPNTGFIQISQEEAISLTKSMADFGKEYFAYTLPCFELLLNAIVASIPCRVSFQPLLDETGYYSKADKQIVIANNNSQISIIWALLHEYVHFLLNSDRMPPCTIEEYIADKEEYLCNAVAYNFIISLFGNDFVKTICENILLKIQNASLDSNNISKKPMEYMNFSPEEKLIFSVMNEEKYLNEESLQDDIDSLINRILTAFEYQTEKNIEGKIDCRQTGLVVLSRCDNEKLYDMIVHEISVMMPSDND